jgi:hypothetical protein
MRGETVALPAFGRAGLYIHGALSQADPGHPGWAAGPFQVAGPAGSVRRIAASDPQAETLLRKPGAVFRPYEPDQRAGLEMRRTRAQADAALVQRQGPVRAPAWLADHLDQIVAGLFAHTLCSMSRIVISVRGRDGGLYVTCRDREKRPGHAIAVSRISPDGATIMTPPGETISSSWAMARAFHGRQQQTTLLHCHLRAATQHAGPIDGASPVEGVPRTPGFADELAACLQRAPVAIRRGDGVWCAGDDPEALIGTLVALQTRCLTR